jgi:DNA recombination protein RmuC
MEALFSALTDESQRLFILGIAAVVVLAVSLLIVIFISQNKALRDRLADAGGVDQIKNNKIEQLQNEMVDIQIKNASIEQELTQFNNAKLSLQSKKELLFKMQEKMSELEKSESQLIANLEHAIKDFDQLGEAHKNLQRRNEFLVEENSKYRAENAKLQIKLQEQERRIFEKLAMMQDNKEQLKEEFERLAGKIFEGNSQKFAEFSKESLDNMIQPLHIQINEFKKQVADVYDKESSDRAVLKNEIHSLKELNKKISEDAINLTKALKGDSKKQGVWGEMVLEHVLEASGLRKGVEYEREATHRGEENELFRPDVIVHLPDHRDLIIDSKTSLVSYERYVNSADDAEKARHLTAHAESINAHINELAKKSYERLKEVNTLDFVFMFMPIEGALAVALEYDSSLYDNAFKKKILLVGPTTLLVAMRAVENVWKYERQNQNAKEIARRAGAMYDKFVSFSEDIVRISRQLDTVQGSFHAAKNKLNGGKGNLVRQAEQLKELGAQTSRQVPLELQDDRA